MIARLQLEKGVNEYCYLANKYKNLGYNFTLVGSINSLDPSRIKISTLDTLVSDKVISYIPFTSNVLSLYDSADCFILPSYREGLSTVLVEAASSLYTMLQPLDVPEFPAAVDRESRHRGLAHALRDLLATQVHSVGVTVLILALSRSAPVHKGQH